MGSTGSLAREQRFGLPEFALPAQKQATRLGLHVTVCTYSISRQLLFWTRAEIRALIHLEVALL